VTTQQVTTQQVTTQQAPPTTAPTTQPQQEPEPASASRLNDRGYELMQAGRYQDALPMLEQAVAALAGTGELAEAYASYNLAYTRRALGRCDGVVELLDRSEQVQGERQEISKLRKEAEKACG